MKSDPAPPPVYPDPDLFFGELKVQSKAELFSLLIAALVRRGLVADGRALLEALLYREARGTSAVGGGIAFPHVRAHMVRATAFGFARLRPALDFGAPDGRPVVVTLFLVAPDDIRGAFYRPLLGVFADVVRAQAQRRRLLAVTRYEELEELVRRDVWSRLEERLSR